MSGRMIGIAKLRRCALLRGGYSAGQCSTAACVLLSLPSLLFATLLAAGCARLDCWSLVLSSVAGLEAEVGGPSLREAALVALWLPVAELVPVDQSDRRA